MQEKQPTTNALLRTEPFGSVILPDLEKVEHKKADHSHTTPSYSDLRSNSTTNNYIFGQNSSWNHPTQNTTVINNYGNSRSNNTSKKKEDKEKKEDKLGAIAAFFVFTALAAIAIVVYPYVFKRAYKLINNLLEGRKKLGSSIQLFGIGVAGVAATMAGYANGTYLLGAIFGATYSPIIATLLIAPLTAGIAAFTFKHAIRFSAWLYTGRTNLAPYSLSKKAIGQIKDALDLNPEYAVHLVSYYENKAQKLLKDGKARFNNSAATNLPTLASIDCRKIKHDLKNNPGDKEVLDAIYNEFGVSEQVSQYFNSFEGLTPEHNNFNAIPRTYNAENHEGSRRFKMQHALIDGFNILKNSHANNSF